MKPLLQHMLDQTLQTSAGIVRLISSLHMQNLDHTETLRTQ